MFTSSCNVSVWSTRLFLHLAAANLFLSHLILLLIPRLPPSPPVHFLLLLLTAWLEQFKAGGRGGARCHHCGHPSLLPVRRVHVDVRLVLQRRGREARLVLVTLRLLNVDEHLLDRLQGSRGERVGGVARWVQRHVTPKILLAYNLDPSCHLPFLILTSAYSSYFPDSPILTPH